MPDTIQGCNVAVAINCMFEDEVEPGLKLSFQLAHNLLPATSYLGYIKRCVHRRRHWRMRHRFRRRSQHGALVSACSGLVGCLLQAAAK